MNAIDMVQNLLAAYIDVKTSNIGESIALYRVVTELDVPELIGKVGVRMSKAIAAMLDGAADLEFEDVMLVTNMLRAAMTGVTRTVFEQNASPTQIRKMHMELRIMCQAYVQAIGIARTTPVSGKIGKHAA